MHMRTLVAASLAATAFTSLPLLAAVVGGGSTLPQGLYTTPGVLGAGFDVYTGTNSGKGKSAFLNNSAVDINKSGVAVDFAASDSVLTGDELNAYNRAHNSVSNSETNKWGPLIQIPSVATSVTIPFRLTLDNGSAVTDLNLTSSQLCDVFSGALTKWNHLNARYPDKEIKVFYFSGSNGASEILSRHLNYICPARFKVDSAFAIAQIGTEPATFKAVQDDLSMVNAVNNTEGAIGYAGPENVEITNNGKVARVNGLLPTFGNVKTALASISPPSTSASRANPVDWAPSLANPASGYALIAYTYFIFSQCYRDETDATHIRAFLYRHYGLSDNNDAVIVSKNLIPLQASWKSTVRVQFGYVGSALGINNPSVCNGQGRPG